MRREKRTVYLMPDLAGCVDQAAATGGVSPSAIVETALAEHFARESMFAAVEALTRRVGEMDERINVQQSTLARVDDRIDAVGRGLAKLVKMLTPAQPAEPLPISEPPPAPVRETEPARPSGWLGGLGRR